MYWISDVTTWGYGIISLMGMWSTFLCGEYVYRSIKGRKKISPFFYYVALLLLAIVITNIKQIHIRLANHIIWIENPEDVLDIATYATYKRLTSWAWALRLVPMAVSVMFITIDFTMRRFWDKRLFGRLYYNGRE